MNTQCVCEHSWGQCLTKDWPHAQEGRLGPRPCICSAVTIPPLVIHRKKVSSSALRSHAWRRYRPALPSSTVVNNSYQGFS